MNDCKFGEILPNRHEVRLGDYVKLYDHARLGAYSGPIIMEEGSWLSYSCFVRGPLTIGKRAAVGPNTVIVGFQHIYQDVDTPFLDTGVKVDPVVIEEAAMVASNCYIGSGVTIGKHAVVGAGSVVTKDIPPYTVAVGNPARVIKRYDFEKKEWVRVKEFKP